MERAERESATYVTEVREVSRNTTPSAVAVLGHVIAFILLKNELRCVSFHVHGVVMFL